jgi:hypothetical protein
MGFGKHKKRLKNNFGIKSLEITHGNAKVVIKF